MNTALDEQDCHAYPMMTFQRKFTPKMCGTCQKVPAQVECHNDALADAWPMYMCELCNYHFHYDTNGGLLRSDYKVWPYYT